MKGSVGFDPNNAKFTQKIDECSGRVNALYSTENGAALAEKSILQKGVLSLF